MFLGDDSFLQKLVIEQEDNRKILHHYDIGIVEIIEAVSKEWKIPKSEICSQGKSRKGSFGREIVLYLSKELTGMSLREIGSYLKKGESAMSHRFRSINKKLEKNIRLRKKIAMVSKSLISGKNIILCQY